MLELSDPQKAYEEEDGPILLLAGPGTGKTYQLKHRIRYLIEEQDIKPHEITVISFTSESARDLRKKLNEIDTDRNCAFLAKEKQPKNIITMHALGNSILAHNPEKIRLDKNYNVITDDKIKEILIQDAALVTGNENDEWKETKDCRQAGKCERDPNKLICRICDEYKRILTKCNAVDYDSQILAACGILKRNNSVAEEWRNKTKYLLVDEYQDINHGQYELIDLLTKNHRKGLFVVGDDDQSIYKFRGSSPDYIKYFDKYFGDNVKVGRLSISYRCPEHILKGAKSIIEKYYTDSEAKPEPTFSEEIKSNNKIRIEYAASEKYEADKIADIAKVKLEEGKSVIIIVPTKDYVMKLKNALDKKRLNYKYRTKPNKDGAKRFIDMANWLEKPKCNWRLRHIIDHIIYNNDNLTNLVSKDCGITEKRFLATKTISELWKKVNKNKSLLAVLKQVSSKENENAFIAELYKCIENLQKLIKSDGGRRNRISEFLEICGNLIAPVKSPNGLFNDLRIWYNEIAGISMTQSSRSIKIYNLPSSKGLEADVVFVVGLEEGIMPKPDKNIDEEARLFYVAMTRAKEELILFSAKSRSSLSTRKGHNFEMKQSVFVKSIPNEHKM